MGEYKNPIPSLDDESQSRSVIIKFTFDEPVTCSEAAESLNQWFQSNKLTPEMIRLIGPGGVRFKEIQPTLSENNSDPKGHGPRGLPI